MKHRLFQIKRSRLIPVAATTIVTAALLTFSSASNASPATTVAPTTTVVVTSSDRMPPADTPADNTPTTTVVVTSSDRMPPALPTDALQRPAIQTPAAAPAIPVTRTPQLAG
jgi:hypothetical protein